MVFFPKKTDFFELFDKSVDNLSRAADTFFAVLSDFKEFPTVVKQLHDFEQDGDMITHDIIKELNKTFLTPLDREDIHALASRLDDVLDLIWACADRMNVYRVDQPTPEIKAMAEDIQITVWILKKVVGELRTKGYEHIREHCIEINRLENRVDRHYRDALGKLLNGSNDPIYVIKWKDIYQLLEDASDRCEDVANILEGIVLKHA
jgi:predicted phosphate transport protein (TIGR00153 family)